MTPGNPLAGSAWMWLAIAGLGVFHGINPAMGWLFAVALGLYRRSSRVVALSLIPIALGHMIAAGLMLAAGLSLSMMVDHVMLGRLCGVLLIGWAAWHVLRKHRMRTRVGMQTGFVGLAGWSFAMAGSHGAGLMLIPVLTPICNAYGAVNSGAGASAWIALAAILVHSIAMLLTIATISFAVFGWFGLAGLRTKWVNFDLLWGLSLGVCGAVQVLSR